MPLEIEAKLAAPDAAALAGLPSAALRAGYLVGEIERSILHDHYLDTDDLHLYRAGWALRLRDLGTRQLLTMKALTPARDGLAMREEREEPVTWAPRAGWVVPAAALGGEPVRLAAGAPFERLFTLRQDRSVFPLASAEGGNEEGFWCEASMNLVRWTARDGAPLEAYEAEFELKRGTAEQLSACVRAIREATGWPPASTSKFLRGLEAAGLAV